MPCEAGITSEVFRDRSYMIHAQYHPWTVDHVQGVVFYMSTGESNRMAAKNDFHYWHHYEVFFVPGCFAGMIFGTTGGGRMLGKLAQVFPNHNRHRNLEHFVRMGQCGRMAFASVYDVWAGYSQRELTADGAYYAVDLYLQTPDMYPLV